MIAVRVATEADIRILFEIRTSVGENHMDLGQLAAVGVTPESVAAMLRTDARAWVASLDGVDAAFSMANASEATVFAMFVRPGFEDQGLGRVLMREAEKWLCESGCGEIWLLTGGNPAIRAHGFYKRLGWRDAGVQPDGQIKYVKECGAAAAGEARISRDGAPV